ncbi:MAG: hypothetical protein HPY62_05200 [Bacteroidales bacterium]|nr:hypothetical protein [Bacteroidales bacterium]
MKIINFLNTGISRAVKSWKGILIIWIFSLILAGFISFPLSSVLKRSFGNSMVTERLMDGLDVEVFADLGSNLSAFLFPGLFFVFLIGFILTSFLNGGLFDSFREDAGEFSVSAFLSSGARNFWSFLLIAIIIRMIIYFTGVLFVGIPLILLLMENSTPGNSPLIILIITSSLYFVMLPVLLLVADYARAGKAANPGWSGFKALGFGFSKTFDRFGNSYLMMIILTLAHVLFILLVINTIPFWKPQTGKGVFLMFLITQLLLIINLALKAWRYASVTASGEPYCRKNAPVSDLAD